MVKKDSNRAATQLVQAIGISAMTDTIQKIADEMCNSHKLGRTYMGVAPLHVEQWAERLRALSARASAGEGGLHVLASSFQRRAREGDILHNQYDKGRASAFEAAADELTAILTAAPQLAQETRDAARLDFITAVPGQFSTVPQKTSAGNYVIHMQGLGYFHGATAREAIDAALALPAQAGASGGGEVWVDPEQLTAWFANPAMNRLHPQPQQTKKYSLALTPASHATRHGNT